MTTTDLAGLPAEIAAVLARAGVAQDAACDEANLPRTSYYRRKRQPGAWRIAELEDFLDVAGVRLEVNLAGHRVELETTGVGSFRLGELSALAQGMGSGLALSLEAKDVVIVPGGTDA